MSDELVPRFGVRIQKSGEKTPTSQDISDRVTSFSFEDNVRLIDKVTISIDNHDLEGFDNPLFCHDNVLQVQWGYVGRMTPLRTCVIASLKGGFPVLTIEAISHAVSMDTIKKTRRFENVTRSAVAKQIADEHGFGTDAVIEDTEHVYPSIQQVAQSDAAFLTDLAHKEGFEFRIEQVATAGGGDGKDKQATGPKAGLHFHRRKLDQQPVKELRWYSSQGDAAILSLDYEEDHRTKKGKHGVSGRDPTAKKNFKTTASNSATPHNTLGSAISIITADEAVGESTGVLVPGTNVAKEESGPTSQPQPKPAKRVADGAYLGQQHRAIKLRGSLVGDPDLRAGRIAIFSGIGHRLQGPWYLTKVVHKIDQGGYITDFEAERDAHNGYKDTKRDVKPKGKANTQKPPSPGGLVQRLVENPQTGETELKWQDP